MISSRATRKAFSRAMNHSAAAKLAIWISTATKRKVLLSHAHANIPKGSEIHTAALRSYEGLAPEYVHKVVDHADCYVKDGVHTNGLENFWSLLKRTLKGTYVYCATFHLYRYLDEQTYRFNARKHEDGDQGRFLDVVKTATGR
jgi:hypothetical protein